MPTSARAGSFDFAAKHVETRAAARGTPSVTLRVPAPSKREPRVRRREGGLSMSASTAWNGVRCGFRALRADRLWVQLRHHIRKSGGERPTAFLQIDADFALRKDQLGRNCEYGKNTPGEEAGCFLSGGCFGDFILTHETA